VTLCVCLGVQQWCINRLNINSAITHLSSRLSLSFVYPFLLLLFFSHLLLDHLGKLWSVPLLVCFLPWHDNKNCFFIHYKTVFLIRECFCYFIMIEAKYNSMISVRHGKCRMRSGKVLDSDANLLSTYVGCVIWKRTLYPSLKYSLFHSHTHTHTHYNIYIFYFHKSHWQQRSHHAWMQRPGYCPLCTSSTFLLSIPSSLLCSALCITSSNVWYKRTRCHFVDFSYPVLCLLRSSVWISHLK